MEELFVAILSVLLVLALIPLYLWKRRSDRKPSEQDEPNQVPRGETVVRATGSNRRMRRRAVSGGASTSTAAAAPVEESVDGSDDGEGDTDDYYEAKASKKKEKKKQERETRRQAEEAARDTRQSKQDRYAEMRKRKDEEHEALERKLEEEAKAQKAREEEAAALEFEKWKGDFTVDDEGALGVEGDGSQDLLTNFVEYIKTHKCVPLEDLAAEFKLRTQECINRISSLESMGRVSGVMDDRGKYIYISQEEMKAVADYIRRQGRVNISHLASKSNQFIDLEPKAQFTEESINAEEISAN